MHGLFSSRLEGGELHDAAQKQGARIICPDRPGIGLPTLQPNRRVLDWPADVRQLAKHLSLEKFTVLGGSGGASYALACAEALPKEMLSGVGILAGAGPWDTSYTWDLPRRVLFGLFGHSPIVTERLLEWLVVRKTRPDNPEVMRKYLKSQMKYLRQRDRQALAAPGAMDTMARLFRESFRQGAMGNAVEVRLVKAPWGFRLEDVEFEGVRLWYGEKDVHTPVEMGRIMARRLRGSRLKIYEGDSHFSVGEHTEEILRELLEEV